MRIRSRTPRAAAAALLAGAGLALAACQQPVYLEEETPPGTVPQAEPANEATPASDGRSGAAPVTRDRAASPPASDPRA